MSESDTTASDAETTQAFEGIIRVETLAAFLDRAQALVDEARIHVERDGLRLTAVDPANVAMVDQTLAADAFESYEAPGAVLGVNLGRLDDVVSVADSDALVSLSLDIETNKLQLQTEGLDWTLALIDPDSIREEPDIPNPSENTTAEAVIEARHLDTGQKAADLVTSDRRGGHVRFGFDADTETFIISAQGDTDDVTMEIEREDMVALRRSGDAGSLYSLDYVSDVVKPLDKSHEVAVQVGEEWPIYMDHSWAEGRGETRYCITPRIQEG